MSPSSSPLLSICQVVASIILPALETDSKWTVDDTMAANKRHRLFTKQTSESGGWRPKKLYRGSANRNVECWDDWIGTSTHNDGLVVLQPDWKELEWSDANWRNWMSATTILDQGSDNVCDIHVCTYKLGLNMWAMWDHWHGVDNDVLLAYKASDLYALVILFMVVLTLSVFCKIELAPFDWLSRFSLPLRLMLREIWNSGLLALIRC